MQDCKNKDASQQHLSANAWVGGEIGLCEEHLIQLKKKK